MSSGDYKVIIKLAATSSGENQSSDQTMQTRDSAIDWLTWWHTDQPLKVRCMCLLIYIRRRGLNNNGGCCMTFLCVCHFPASDTSLHQLAAVVKVVKILRFGGFFRSNRPMFILCIKRKNPGKKSSKASILNRAKTLYVRVQKLTSYFLFFTVFRPSPENYCIKQYSFSGK